MGLRRGPAIVSRGLLSAYDFASVRSYPYQDSPGGTSPLLKDLVGDNDMTVEGAPTFFGNNSNSAVTSTAYMTFSPSGAQITQYCICNPFPFPTSELTVEVWHRMVLQSSQQGLISYATSNANNEGLMFWNASSWRWYGPDSNSISTNVTTDNGKFCQLVRTSIRSTGAEKCYVDGDQKFSGTMAAGTDFETGGALVFAQEQDSVGGGFDSGECFQGNLSLVRIYNRALSAHEVKQNYLATAYRFFNLRDTI